MPLDRRTIRRLHRGGIVRRAQYQQQEQRAANAPQEENMGVGLESFICFHVHLRLYFQNLARCLPFSLKVSKKRARY